MIATPAGKQRTGSLSIRGQKRSLTPTLDASMVIWSGRPPSMTFFD